MKLFNLKKLMSYKLNEKETQLKNIVVGLLNHSETTVFTCRLTDRYFIINNNLKYYSVLTRIELKLTNHRFFYTEIINDGFFKIIEKLLEEFIKKDRDKIEEEIFKNEKTLLDDIEKQINLNNGNN